ncbi:MAG: hypothetical protein EOM25_13800 [Deltaproteobacteria bacterium]|nr:hypothetical protein [Deltaproteobacteria bacterium]
MAETMNTNISNDPQRDHLLVIMEGLEGLAVLADGLQAQGQHGLTAIIKAMVARMGEAATQLDEADR